MALGLRPLAGSFGSSHQPVPVGPRSQKRRSLAKGCADPGKMPSGLWVRQSWVHSHSFPDSVTSAKLLHRSQTRFPHVWNRDTTPSPRGHHEVCENTGRACPHRASSRTIEDEASRQVPARREPLSPGVLESQSWGVSWDAQLPGCSSRHQGRSYHQPSHLLVPLCRMSLRMAGLAPSFPSLPHGPLTTPHPVTLYPFACLQGGIVI